MTWCALGIVKWLLPVNVVSGDRLSRSEPAEVYERAVRRLQQMID